MKPHHYITINLIVTLITAWALGASMWFLGALEELNALATTAIALSILPLLVLVDARNPQSEYRRWNWVAIGLMSLSLCFFPITFGIRYDLTSLTFNGILLAVSLPWLWLCWKIAVSNRLLLVGLITQAIALFTYLLILIALPDGRLDVFLIPLPVVAVAGAVWAFFVSRSMVCAERSRRRPLLGPGMESLTMFLLVMPLVLLAVLITDALTEGGGSTALVSIAVGLVFSSAISTPFRQFLRVLGGLDEDHRGPIR